MKEQMILDSMEIEILSPINAANDSHLKVRYIDIHGRSVTVFAKDVSIGDTVTLSFGVPGGKSMTKVFKDAAQ